jgi:hypothetical protein
MRRRLVIPLPLWVLEDLLRAGLDIWQLVTRFLPSLSRSADRYLSIANTLVPDLGRVFVVLRKAGPLTLVEVNDPVHGVKVTIRTY